MKKFKASFIMKIRDDCTVQNPQTMLEKDQEDGFELGFNISNIEVTKLPFTRDEAEDMGEEPEKE
jgi:hypothetical protein